MQKNAFLDGGDGSSFIELNHGAWNKHGAKGIMMNRIAGLFLCVGIAWSGIACQSDGRLDPHEAYKQRMSEGADPATGAEVEPTTAFAVYLLKDDVDTIELNKTLRSLLIDSGQDVALFFNVSPKAAETLGQAAEAAGFQKRDSRHGVVVLSKRPVVGREGRMANYPFDAILLELPGERMVWLSFVDTSAAVNKMAIQQIMETLSSRLATHSLDDLIVVAAYRSPLPEANEAAREVLTAYPSLGLESGGIAVHAGAETAPMLRPLGRLGDSLSGGIVAGAGFEFSDPALNAEIEATTE